MKLEDDKLLSWSWAGKPYSFLDGKGNTKEMVLGSPEDICHLAFIPTSLSWTWHYNKGGCLSPGGWGSYYNIIFFQ